jgi:3-oxoacyl-[acyl-carrier protein] reductase
VQADVAKADDVRACSSTASPVGRVDVLVNNAGIMPPQLPQLAATDDDTFDRLVAINLKGSFNTMREAAARLEQGGRIINFRPAWWARCCPATRPMWPPRPAWKP